MESASLALVRVAESEDDFAFALVGWTDVGHEISREKCANPSPDPRQQLTKTIYSPGSLVSARAPFLKSMHDS